MTAAQSAHRSLENHTARSVDIASGASWGEERRRRREEGKGVEGRRGRVGERVNGGKSGGVRVVHYSHACLSSAVASALRLPCRGATFVLCARHH